MAQLFKLVTDADEHVTSDDDLSVFWLSVDVAHSESRVRAC